MSDDDEAIYQDKIKLAEIITQKELTVIEVHHQLINDIRLRPEIKKELNDYPQYHQVLRNISELFDFLKGDYLDKITLADSAKIKNFMKLYKNLGDLTFEQINEAVDIILDIMTKAKFHDIVRRGELRGLDAVDKRYKLDKKKKAS